MNRILHETNNVEKILQLTADTMLLIAQDGTCVDIDTHSDLWFLQEERLLGKNIFELLPLHTREKVEKSYRQVIKERRRVSKNYKLEFEKETYYFKCIMYPYEEMVLCQYRDITRRSNVKRELEQTNRKLCEIQKAANIGQWRFNTDEKVFHFMGYTCCFDQAHFQIEFNAYLETIVGGDKAVFAEWIDNMQEAFDNKPLTYRIRINEEIHYVRLQVNQWAKQSNGSVDIEGYIQDITDLQRRRNDINTLTHAINSAKESIFAAKRDGTIIFVNRKFMDNHHLSETTDLRKLKIYEVVADMHSLQDWETRLKEALGGKSTNFVASYPLKDNKSTLAFEGTVYSVTNDEGEESFWSFAHDISERIRYESQIKRLNQIMDTTIDNLPAGIVVKDVTDDFRYIFRNRESYNRNSIRKKAIGMNDFDFYPPEEAARKRSEDIEIATTGQEKHWTVEEKDLDGNLLILDKRKILIKGDDFTSPIIISIEWNITELELIKRELQASKEKAELSDHLKSTFLANMSHEIRTPLNAIVGFSQLIAENEDAEERRSYYEIVNANNGRLLSLINEILDLSKIESGIVDFVINPLRLHTLCNEVHDAHVFRTPQGVQLVYDPSDKEILLFTDKNRLFQVFSNLIGNACKFTKEGSISYGYQRKGDFIWFYVKDTGMGIEAEKQKKIFERFAKLNDFAQGTGLGLSICKTIIERMGGEISVVSIPGKGTTFTFSLPYAPHEEYALETEAELTGQTSAPMVTLSKPANEIKILIAEDTDSNYDLLCAILGKTYSIARAKDGIEAVTLFDQIKPDLILMDIKMPNLDGLEATRIIKEIAPDIPIIIQSSYAFDRDVQEAMSAGCNDFISKPISQTLLTETIRKWLGGAK